jgi:hypothetical protein
MPVRRLKSRRLRDDKAVRPVSAGEPVGRKVAVFVASPPTTLIRGQPIVYSIKRGAHRMPPNLMLGVYTTQKAAVLWNSRQRLAYDTLPLSQLRGAMKCGWLPLETPFPEGIRQCTARSARRVASHRRRGAGGEWNVVRPTCGPCFTHGKTLGFQVR